MPCDRARLAGAVRVLTLVGALGAACLLPAAQAQDKPDPVRKALSEKTSLDFKEVPLTDVAEYLHSKHKVHFILDRRATQDGGLDPQTPVTFKVDGITLESALHLLLNNLDMTMVPRYESVLLTLRSTAVGDLERKVYGIRDLMAPPGAPAGDEDDSYAAGKVVDLISATVAPSSWQTAGGQGSIKAIKGMLVVSQTYEIHREIDALLGQLRAVRKAKPGPKAEDPRDKLLLQKTALEFAETPLTEVVESISDRFKTPIVLDRRALENEGIDLQTPITINVKDLTLKSSLPLLLDPLGLTLVKKHEVLVLTTQDMAEQELERRLQDVRDLSRKDTAAEAADQRDSVADIITSSVQPDSWEASGGTGAIRILDGCLVILQTAERHQQIDDLLAELRRVRKEQEK